MMNDYFPINLIVPMKKETLKKIINLIITVLENLHVYRKIEYN